LRRFNNWGGVWNNFFSRDPQQMTKVLSISLEKEIKCNVNITVDFALNISDFKWIYYFTILDQFFFANFLIPDSNSIVSPVGLYVS